MPEASRISTPAVSSAWAKKIASSVLRPPSRSSTECIRQKMG